MEMVMKNYDNIKTLLLIASAFDFSDQLEFGPLKDDCVCSVDTTDVIGDHFTPDYYELAVGIRCNDLFYWGTSDIQLITDNDITTVIQACSDILEVGSCEPNRSRTNFRHEAHRWADNLIACRIRKMRPQGAMYEWIPPEIAVLFDQCGPEREKPGFMGNTARREFKENPDNQNYGLEQYKHYRSKYGPWAKTKKLFKKLIGK